jgi:hypothetical protein
MGRLSGPSQLDFAILGKSAEIGPYWDDLLLLKVSIHKVGAMATRRVIKSVLRSFLGTYTSRYTDYEGYWLFGFLVEDIGELEFDLLSQGGNLDTPLATAEQLAIVKFADQVRKAGLKPEWVTEARLGITKRPDAIRGSVNGRVCDGYEVYFRVSSKMDDDRHYACEQVSFVAPHNPQVEKKSRS